MTAATSGSLPRGTVAIIGPGRVGTVLALALARAGHRIRAGGGSQESRQRIAGLVAGTRLFESASEAARGADLVVLTVPDDAIEAVVTALATEDAVGEDSKVVHTAGSMGLAPLARAGLAGAEIAACHPAQTFPAGGTDPDAIVGAPWAVTAPESCRAWAHALVETVGGTPHDLPDDRRVLYHAGLTVGSNAVAAAVSVARRLLLSAGVDAPAAFLGELVQRSAQNVLESGAGAITGPVVRGDTGTIAAHLEAMRDLPELAETYRLLTEVIVSQVAVGDDGRRLRAAMTAVLRPSEEDT